MSKPGPLREFECVWLGQKEHEDDPPGQRQSAGDDSRVPAEDPQLDGQGAEEGAQAGGGAAQANGKAPGFGEKNELFNIYRSQKQAYYFMVALSWECRKFYIHFVCSCRVCHQTDVHVRNTSLPTCLTPLPKTSQVSTHRMFQDPAMRKPLTCIARSLSRPRWCTKDREKQVRAFSANRTASTARFWRVHWHSSVVRSWGYLYITFVRTFIHWQNYFFYFP